jgi:hypothetical protein
MNICNPDPVLRCSNRRIEIQESNDSIYEVSAIKIGSRVTVKTLVHSIKLVENGARVNGFPLSESVLTAFHIYHLSIYIHLIMSFIC